MNNKQRKIINKVLDEVFEQVERNGSILPQSESAIRRAQFSSMDQYDKKWKKPHDCIYEGCQRPSIKRSHTIQKSGPLFLIAEKQHVLQPWFTGNGKMEMVSVGLNKASVFPGFCSEHEMLFEGFETSKRLDTDRDVVLQCYRTVCRELFRLEFEIEFLKNRLGEYIKFREEYVKKRIADLDNSIGISEVSFAGDFKESSMTEKIAIKKKLSNKIRKGVFRELHEAILGMRLDVAIVNISSPDLLPICLSGLGTLMVELEDKAVREVEIFLSVIPTYAGTKILLCSEKHSEDLLSFYVRKYLDGRLDLLKQIESWMIHQTDHWFITPSHWHFLPERRKASLLELIFSNHSTLSSECRLSVLDQARKNAISEFRMSQEYIDDVDGSEARIRKEKGKLAKIN